MKSNDNSNRRKLFSISRIWGWMILVVKHPFGICVGFLFSFGLGLYIGESWQIITIKEPLKLLGAIAAALSGIIFALFATIKNIFDLEIKEKQLVKLETEKTSHSPEESTNHLIEEIVNGIEEHWRAYDPREEGRAKHWRLEKRFLAKKFVGYLGERIEYIRKTNPSKSIAVIFDAGSTIAPILNELGSQASDVTNHWTKNENISIHTNNLTGVLMLLSHKDFNEKDDRHASLPFECSVLPGDVLSAYAATASESTLKAIASLKQENYILAVSTGNYLFLDIRKNRIAPIARTGMHPEVKSVLATCADEIYYVAPLGKVIICRNETLEQLRIRFNKKMGFSDHAAKPSERSYKLSFECRLRSNFNLDNWYSKSILVTTSRSSGKFFSPHSITVNNGIDKIMEDNSTIPLDTGPLILSWEYDKLPKIIVEQKEIEIPHDYFRKHWTEFFAR